MDSGLGNRFAQVAGFGMMAAMLMGAGSGAVLYGNGAAGSRYTQVATRGTAYTFAGYAENPSEPICAFQQKKDSSMAPIGCFYATQTPYTDACGVTWYWFSVNLNLLTSNDYWFGQHNPAIGKYENAQVYLTRNVSNSGLYTVTDDWWSGPTEYGPTCFRAMFPLDGAVTAMTIYNGGRPGGVACSGTSRSKAGCPFTCNLSTGCDQLYGPHEYEFYNSLFRTNSSGQDTSQIEYDHYGFSSAMGTPPGDWYYGWDSTFTYIVMRRDAVTAESMNIRRGESRRNVMIEAYARNTTSTWSELGLVGRWTNRDRYFVFRVMEYPSDTAQLHRQWDGVYLSITPDTHPSFDAVNSWVRLGLEIRDRGSYVNGGFVPDSQCSVQGFINGVNVIGTSPTGCSMFAPTGGYGVFSSLNNGAMY